MHRIIKNTKRWREARAPASGHKPEGLLPHRDQRTFSRRGVMQKLYNNFAAKSLKYGSAQKARDARHENQLKAQRAIVINPFSFQLQAFSSYATPQIGFFQRNHTITCSLNQEDACCDTSRCRRLQKWLVFLLP